MQVKRRAAVAGYFYPRDPLVLSETIDKLLEDADILPTKAEVVGIIAPHAGYMYSGPVAAYAYKYILGKKFDTVIVIAPSHTAYFSGVSVYPLGPYETPLGDVPLDEFMIKNMMAKSKNITYIPEAHEREHAVEVQLPFLQKVLKDFKLVPLVMGDQSLEMSRELARVIVNVSQGKKVLIVASSDLSHYHPDDVAKEMDARVIDCVERVSDLDLNKRLLNKTAEACGGGPIMALMNVARAKGIRSGKILKYATSGDITGDRSSVVGYLAAAYILGGKQDSQRDEEGKIGVDLGFSEEEKKLLKEIAYKTIEASLKGESYEPEIPRRYSKLFEKRGVFVTLKKNGELRGCIGYIQPFKPLVELVKDAALAAAFNDPRFPPLSLEELPEIELEISVLTPFREITDPEEIVIGRDGLYIVRGPYSGLLLPQVAVEYNMDRKTFLEHACMKAGLSPDAWEDDDTKIYVFSADVF